jgi:hypothetical protein
MLAVCTMSASAAPPTVADAHKPLAVEETPNDSGFGSAKVIPTHRVSWAIYRELEAGSADYYRFEAEKGERFYAQVTVPKLENLAGFTPSLALVGRGISGDLESMQVGSGRLAQDASLAAPKEEGGMGSVIVDYDGPLPSAEFYEPFTQTTYWERQEITIDSLPASGTYYLIVFDGRPGAGLQQASKYTLAVGEIEDFSAVDMFTTLPAAWFSTKMFFGDYLAVAAAVGGIAAVLGLGVAYALRRFARPLPS